MTDIWLTPPHILAALGGAASFDLDPCAPAGRPWDTARAHLTEVEDGLASAWGGRAFVNPPFSQMNPWLTKMAEHGRGTLLIFARTDTWPVIEHVLDVAHALFFVQGRVRFHLPTGERGGKAREPVMLAAYGADDADVLATCGLSGRFQALRLPRSYLIAALAPRAGEAGDAGARSWREEIAAWVRRQSGPVALSDLYRAFACHPKAARNRHFAAKIRQELQRGPFERVARGVWRAA